MMRNGDQNGKRSHFITSKKYKKYKKCMKGKIILKLQKLKIQEIQPSRIYQHFVLVRPEILLDPKKILNSNFLCTQNCLRPTIFSNRIFLNQIFLKLFFWIKIFLDPQFFSGFEIYLVLKFLDQKFYWFQKILV